MASSKSSLIPMLRCFSPVPTILCHFISSKISRVRAKLAIQPDNGWRLASVYGIGYRLDEVNEEGQ